MNLPNLLTSIRILLSFLLIGLMPLPGLAAKTASFAVFAAAALTDLWDGQIARRRGLITKFGVIMDPIADKVLVLSAFYAFMKQGIAPVWVVALIAARELLITGLRLIALAKGKALPAEAAGKMKAAAQMVTISLTLLYLVLLELRPAPPPGTVAWVSTGLVSLRALMLLTVALTLTSGATFLWHNRKQIFA